jgi:hypothetical protein
MQKSISSLRFLRPNKLPVIWIPLALSPWIERLGHKTDCLRISRADIKNAWCLHKHRHNFTFSLRLFKIKFAALKVIILGLWCTIVDTKLKFDYSIFVQYEKNSYLLGNFRCRPTNERNRQNHLSRFGDEKCGKDRQALSINYYSLCIKN